MNKKINTKMNKKPELLAPAGNLEKMKTAFAFGADAVYAGIPDFSMRVRINDFNMRSLKAAIKYAHKKDKKIYVTVNIIAHNRHLEKLPAYIKKLKELKPDGLIASDPGVIQVIKKVWPAAKIHLSTQANCTNWQTAKFWQDQGLPRVILGREVTIDEVKLIHKKAPKLELESFVHGALCMAYSGRCFLSKYFVGRSANLGDCIQPCRWKYNVKSPQPPLVKGMLQAEGRSEVLELIEEEHGSYILNSQDLCLIRRLGELVDAGISSFKIEGRAKSVYYLANIVGAYRKAIDTLFDKKLSKPEKNKIINYFYSELGEKLVHRGYTEGFLFGNGKMAQNLDNSHNKSNWQFCGVVENKKNKSKKKNKKCDIYIKVHNTLKTGDLIEIIMPGYDIIKTRLKRMVDNKTGEELTEAHGGQGKAVIIESDRDILEYSVLRRKVT